MKTKWDTVKNFQIENINKNGMWLTGKALNGRKLVKHITMTTLKVMLCNKEIY